MIRFYKKASNGNFVLDGDEFSYSNSGQFYSIQKEDYLAIYNVFTGEKRHDSPYSEYQKEDLAPYSSMIELTDATYQFFAAPVISGGGETDGTSQYSLYTDPETGLKIKIGPRVGFIIAYDRELTATGFNGIEGTDWENFGGSAS